MIFLGAVLYNQFGAQLNQKTLEDFASCFNSGEHTTGHVFIFGLSEPYFEKELKDQKKKWQESTFHQTEAKVIFFEK